MPQAKTGKSTFGDIKILKHISIVIAVIIALAYIAIQLPKLDAVQRKLALFVSDIAGQQLGIPINIERLKFENLNEIMLSDILILDETADTLIYADKAAASIELEKLLNSKLHINTLTFAAPDIRLSKNTPDSPLNIQFIIDNLNKESEEENDTDLRINQLIIYDGRFRYDVFSEKPVTGKLDLNHIQIDGFASNISLKHFNKESLNLYIRSISGSEKSGLELRKLRTMVTAQEGNIVLEKFSLELPGSIITSEELTLTGAKSISSMTFDGELRCKRLSLDDLAPAFPEIPTGLPAFRFNISGHADSTAVNGRVLIAATDGSLALEGKATATAPFTNKRRIEITLDRLSAKESTIDRAASFLAEPPYDIASRLGDTDIDGKILMSCESVDGYANINSQNGALYIAMTADSLGRYNITTKGTGIHLGNILDNGEFGTCSLSGKAKGSMKESDRHADFNLEISEFVFKEYTYAPIKIDGKARKSDIRATLATADANISTTIGLLYRKNRTSDKISVNLKVDSIIPYNLNLYKEESHSFAFNMDGDVELRKNGKSLTNIKLQNFTFNDGNETASIRNFHLYDDNTEEKRSITVNSDILNADIIGYFDTGRLIDSYIRTVNMHAPALELKGGRTRTRNNYFYRVEVMDSRLLSKLFKLPFTINEKSLIYGSCFDKNNTANIDIELNNVTVGGSVYRAINLKGASNNDELTVDANILKPQGSKKKGFDYKDNANDLIINLHSSIDSDTINSMVDWREISDNEKNKGTLRMDAALSRDTKDNLCVEANVSPGSFTLDGSQWHITPGRIKGNSEKIAVSDLGLYNKEQSLKIEGTAGKFIEDSLNVHLSSMDVATIMGIVNFRILLFGGKATGSAHLTSLLYRPDVNGQFHIDSLHIDDAYMGDGELGISWMDYNKTISLDCDILAKEGNSKVSGILSPAQDTIMLRIDADSLNVGFLNKKVGAFIDNMQGTANGTAYVLGKWRSVDLKGDLYLNSGCSARVKANNVTYTFIGDSLLLRPGIIEFRNMHLKDRAGNRGMMNGRVTHKNFSKWACHIDVEADKMLVYDTNDFSSMPFYGTAYASGSASIVSDGTGLTLKAGMRSEANSSFVYNSSTASGARDNSFVTFVDSNRKSAAYTPSPEESYKNTYDLVTSKLNLEFMIDVTDDFHIKVFTDLRTGDYIDFYSNGAISALYDDKNGFSMKGLVALERGTYKFTIQDIFPKEFNIQKGSTLSFDGDPFKAALNLRTKYLVPSASLSDLTTETAKNKTVKVNCVMDIGGTLEKPALSFDLELPEGSGEEKELLASVASTAEQKNMQFIYLLGVGKFYTYDYNNTSNESQSSTAMESLISNTLSGQLNNMLGQIIDNDNWDISGNFSSSERGWNRMEVEGMLRGRLLNNRLLINGNFGYRENPIANSNFIGDFELQWLLNQKGNVNLKAYSKTNDRYFSKTNLTTQGAGILFKFDFDSWKWWRRKKETTEESDNKE